MSKAQRSTRRQPDEAAASRPEALALRIAWWLLLVALVAVPIVISTGGLGSGAYALKRWVARLLVSGSLIAWGYAVIQHRLRIRWHPAVWLGVAYIAWAGVCVVFSESVGTSLIGNQLSESSWLAMSTYAVAAWLTLQLADSWHKVRDMARTITLTGGVVALYGLVQILPDKYDPFLWTKGLYGEFRSFATFGNPDMYGAYAALVLFVAAALLFIETDRWWRLASAVSFVLIGTSVFTSLTRAAWIGAVVGAVCILIFAWRLGERPARGQLVTLGVLAASIAVAAFLAATTSVDVDSNLATRVPISQEGGGLEANTSSRLESWSIALEALSDRPVFGWGPDTYHLAFERNRTSAYSRIVDSTVTPSSAHNWLLQTAVTTGVPGLLLKVALFAVVAVLSAKWLWRTPPGQGRGRLAFAGAWSACAAYLAAAALVPASPPSKLLLWCLLGVLLSPLSRKLGDSFPGRVRALGIAAMLLGVAWVVVTSAQLYADTEAAVAMDAGRPAFERVQAAETATWINPLKARYAVAKGDAYRALLLESPVPTSTVEPPALVSAVFALNDAIELEPSNPYHHTALVSMLLVGGQIMGPEYQERALDEAVRARSLYPNNLDVAYWHARALRATGDLAGAEQVLYEIWEVRPGFSDAALLLSDLLVARGDEPKAVEVLEASLEQRYDTRMRSRLNQVTPKGREL